ncbi:MAG: hypothetical protein PHQ42_05175 [Patescibacteria group bacterium]|nr:hypothetical protein [Patescibacteria group bacterium]
MFGLFKKQKKDKSEESKVSEKDQEMEVMNKRIGKEITIHTMPAKFRQDGLKTDKAKKTGIFVMVGGFIFIIIIAFLLYFFIFRAPEEKQAAPFSESKVYAPEPEAQTEAPAGVQEEEEGEAEGVPPVATLEDYLGGLEETATSTIPGEEEIIATSTPEAGIIREDGDGDGLTWKEEILLGTSDENIDSDGDGYSDFEEVMNLYDPAGSGKLGDNPNIGEYSNAIGYKVLYPLIWSRISVGGDDSIMFKSEDDGQFIQIIVQNNAEKQSVKDWHEQQFGIEAIEPSREITGIGWSGIKSEEGLVVYLVDDNRDYIFVLSYNAGPDGILSYKNIFSAMIKSFSL